MTKPHAGRISWATGWDIQEVRDWLNSSDEPYESTEDVIAAIEHHEALEAAWNSDLPFDHAMGRYLGGL